MAAIRYTQVHGLRMAYGEVGRGDPIVFLHGNPTSSYLWRDVLGRVAHRGRCLAPDLIGMGASDKVPGPGRARYRFVEHRQYLDALLDALRGARPGRPRRPRLGWCVGRRLGASPPRRGPRHRLPGDPRGPGVVGGAERARSGLFGPLRGPDGERLVLAKNVFVEKVLQAATLRTLTGEEMDGVPRPYREPGRVAAADASRGHVRSRSTVSQPTSTRSSPGTRGGWRRRRCRSCSSTATPVRC